MPKRNDGNEQDLRVRPDSDAQSLDADNPFTGARPDGTDDCYQHGTQTDIPVVTTPSGPPTPPLIDWTDVSRVCPRGFDNRAMDQLIIRILKNHFSQPDCIMYDAVKQFTWNPDAGASDIRIVMNTTFDASQSGKMPALVVKRLRQQMKRVVMGDRNASQGDDLGEQGYSRFQLGGHRVMCLGTADGFVEDFAYEVFDLFNAVSPVLRSELPLHDFQVAGMSEVGILEDLGSTLGVAIDLTYAFEYSWTVEYRTPTLARTRVDLTTNLLEVGD